MEESALSKQVTFPVVFNLAFAKKKKRTGGDIRLCDVLQRHTVSVICQERPETCRLLKSRDSKGRAIGKQIVPGSIVFAEVGSKLQN